MKSIRKLRQCRLLHRKRFLQHRLLQKLRLKKQLLKKPLQRLLLKKLLKKQFMKKFLLKQFMKNLRQKQLLKKLLQRKKFRKLWKFLQKKFLQQRKFRLRRKFQQRKLRLKKQRITLWVLRNSIQMRRKTKNLQRKAIQQERYLHRDISGKSLPLQSLLNQFTKSPWRHLRSLFTKNPWQRLQNLCMRNLFMLSRLMQNPLIRKLLMQNSLYMQSNPLIRKLLMQNSLYMKSNLFTRKQHTIRTLVMTMADMMQLLQKKVIRKITMQSMLPVTKNMIRPMHRNMPVVMIILTQRELIMRNSLLQQKAFPKHIPTITTVILLRKMRLRMKMSEFRNPMISEAFLQCLQRTRRRRRVLPSICRILLQRRPLPLRRRRKKRRNS